MPITIAIGIVLLALLVIPTILWAGWVLYWTIGVTLKGCQKREPGQWLIESVLVQAYRKSSLRPKALYQYLNVVILIRLAWKIAVAYAVGDFLQRRIPSPADDAITLLYATAAIAFITASTFRDVLRVQTWRAMHGSLYHHLRGSAIPLGRLFPAAHGLG